MCGVAGCLGEGVDMMALVRAMKHRGTQPIRVAKVAAGSVGHVRLPIVGLDRKYDQPVLENGQVIAFVGEVFDFRDEDSEAECDLPVVTRAWHRNGARGLADRDGFWSVVVLDDKVRELHAFCDYLGQKPLYYREDLKVVASEIDPLVGLAPTHLDELYLSSCAKWGYCQDTRSTPYREIKRVLPGEHVTFSEDEAMQRSITDPLLPCPMTDMALKWEIQEAVKRRVVASDVPVAALVSGGLDSAITYTIAKRWGDVHAFHVENGEALAASLVVGGCVQDATLLDCWAVTLTKALTYMQEPIDLGSLMPQVALSDAIRRSGDLRHVCLSGDGADELFGGYGRAMRYDSQATDVWHELVNWHLPRLDRVMMRNAIELRSPFLARRVAGGALALPWRVRQDKRLLRDLFRDDLPSGVADTPKRPLRTRDVEDDREKRSLDLIGMLRGAFAHEASARSAA